MIVALLVFSLVLQGAFSLNIPRAPSRPVLPNSFSFNATLEFYGGSAKASFGTNFETGNSFLKIELPTTCSGDFGVVSRYDIGTGLMYSTMRIGDLSECLPVPLGSKPTVGIFDWLKTAEYEGQFSDMVAGRTLDVWKATAEVNGDLFRLGVSTTNANMPVALYINAVKPMSERMFHIQRIEPNPPRDSAFAIPADCPRSLTFREVHPLVMPLMTELTGATNSRL